MKVAEYAEAGIPAYWLIDLDTDEVICFALSDGSYQVAGRGRRVERVEICGVEVTVDLAELTD